MSDTVGFFRKNGRIIPMHKGGDGVYKARGAGKLAKVGHIAKLGAIKGVKAASLVASAQTVHEKVQQHRANPKQDVPVNKKLDAFGLGTAVLSGAIGAATFSSGAKTFLTGAVGSHAVDLVGISANLASVAGKGKTQARAKQAARQEARNFLVGNGVYLAGIAATKSNREAAAKYAEKAVLHSKKILDFARKALIRT